MANQWFRLYSEFAFDPKVQAMSEQMQRRYVMLLCLKSNGDLKTVTQNNESVTGCNGSITLEEAKETKNELMEFGFIDEFWNINGWEKRQYISDLRDPTNNERQKRYREKKRNAATKKRNGSVTVEKRPDTDTDTDKKTSKKETPLPEAKPEMPDKLASVCVAQQQQQEKVCAERVERESTGGRESVGEKELYPDKQSTGDGVQMRLVKSDSSSAREDLPRARDPAAESFERFWQVFPGRRKSAKGECLKRWRKHKLHTQSSEIMRFVQGMKQGDWAAGKEQFIPAPLVVINQRRWEGWEQPEAARDVAFAGAL